MEGFAAIVDHGIPDAATFQRLTTVVLDCRKARELSQVDPFSPEYRKLAFQLYLELRGSNDNDYIAERDESSAVPPVESAWKEASPFGFRDTKLMAEHLLSWAHIFNLLQAPQGCSILEYGPGSGQILLMLARMGFDVCGVDIDPGVATLITHQAAAMGLDVPVEQARFGEGFGGRRFDRIIFFEAFHHAFDFDDLLRRLDEKLNPFGRIILCGEPIVPMATPSIPFAWGPRLDALSAYCIRKYGWMELGFTHDFFVEMARRSGWLATYHDVPGQGRACAYSLMRIDEGGAATVRTHCPPISLGADFVEESAPRASPASVSASQLAQVLNENERLRQQIASVYASNSWRLSSPLRAAKKLIGRIRTGG